MTVGTPSGSSGNTLYIAFSISRYYLEIEVSSMSCPHIGRRSVSPTGLNSSLEIPISHEGSRQGISCQVLRPVRLLQGC